MLPIKDAPARSFRRTPALPLETTVHLGARNDGVEV